jgi:hypothetical protein
MTYEIRTMGQKVDYILLRLEEISAALNIVPRLSVDADFWADTIRAGATKIVDSGDKESTHDRRLTTSHPHEHR